MDFSVDPSLKGVPLLEEDPLVLNLIPIFHLSLM